MANVKLFLSCVSDEFGPWREELRRELTSLKLDVAIQEDFGALGVDTLSKLDAISGIVMRSSIWPARRPAPRRETSWPRNSLRSLRT